MLTRTRILALSAITLAVGAAAGCQRSSSTVLAGPVMIREQPPVVLFCRTEKTCDSKQCSKANPSDESGFLYAIDFERNTVTARDERKGQADSVKIGEHSISFFNGPNRTVIDRDTGAFELHSSPTSFFGHCQVAHHQF